MTGDRTGRAVAAAVTAGRNLGLDVRHGAVLHDVFSVVVHLQPEPVVARVPVVLTSSARPEQQSVRQQRELDVAAWLHDQGVPVVPPSPLVPRRPVRRDGFSMTFWELADLAPDHEPYRGAGMSYSAALHAALAGYPGELPFLGPFNDGLPEMLEHLGTVDLLTVAEIDRARDEFADLREMLSDRAAFAAAFGGIAVQPLQGDAPSHNVIRTTSGIRFSDFEDVTSGPVEWDLALLEADAVAEYDAAARRRGMRTSDPQVRTTMDRARRLQFIGCLTLIPQLPVLAQGLSEVLAQWRAQVGSP
ncbi:phosphotransferase [Mycobacterium sp. 4D054]|uniref:phosphotransferase n=1 Tax=Mycobacterium sp. 4D054 TaxID=3457440 RepID=UPI003FD4D93F